jgi:hypothetical protein
MGAKVNLEPGTRLIGVMAVGQNRWMFHTEVKSTADSPDPQASRVAWSSRCPIASSGAPDVGSSGSRPSNSNWPNARCWPLIDPASAVAAEVASRTHVLELIDIGQDVDEGGDEVLDRAAGRPGSMSASGFRATVQNIGGGGLGLKVPREDRSAVESSKLYWTRLDLRP